MSDFCRTFACQFGVERKNTMTMTAIQQQKAAKEFSKNKE